MLTLKCNLDSGRHGFDCHPCTNHRSAQHGVSSFLNVIDNARHVEDDLSTCTLQIQTKSSAEEILAIYDQLVVYPVKARMQHIGQDILDMVVSATVMTHDLERCQHIIQDADKLGFQTSTSQKVALCTCQAA